MCACPLGSTQWSCPHSGVAILVHDWTRHTHQSCGVPSPPLRRTLVCFACLSTSSLHLQIATPPLHLSHPLDLCVCVSLCLRSLQIAISPYTAKGTVVNNPTPVAPGVGMYYEHSSIPKSLHALFAPQVRACPFVAPCVCMYVRFPLCSVCISPHPM
jgi:hypothetical protein